MTAGVLVKLPIVMTFLVVQTAHAITSENILKSSLNTKNHEKWISRIFSDHIWNYYMTARNNPNCMQHFKIFRQHQANFSTWALQMLDASDLIPTGFLVGDGYRLGNFDECLQTNIPSELGFFPQYCLPSFTILQEEDTQNPAVSSNDWREPIWKRLQDKSRTKVPKNRFSLSFCIPSTCAPDDLRTSLQVLFHDVTRPFGYDLNVTVDDLHCTKGRDWPESAGYVIMRSLLVVATVILIFCSVADIVLAAIQDGKYDLTNCSFTKASGIAKWLIPFSFYRNMSQLLAEPTSSNDYKILHGIKFVLLVMTIVGHRSMFIAERAALTNWSYFEKCLPHSYYIAADMHFFIVGSIIVFLCWRWKSHKWIILGSALILSALIPFTITYLNRYEGLVKLYADFYQNMRNHKMLTDVSMKSHNRFGGYMIGIAGAFWMRHLQEKQHTLSKAGAWAGVFIGVIMIAAITIARHSLHLPTTEYNVTIHALFAGLNTQILCAGVITIVVIQITTDFGALDSLFLTQNLFPPFSRLSFWAFLINIPLIMNRVGSYKTHIHITHEDMIYGGQHWGDVPLTYFLSLYCHLLIDAPISYIKPIILKYLSRRQLHVDKKE